MDACPMWHTLRALKTGDQLEAFCLVEGRGALISSSCHHRFLPSSGSRYFPVISADPLTSPQRM